MTGSLSGDLVTPLSADGPRWRRVTRTCTGLAISLVSLVWSASVNGGATSQVQAMLLLVAFTGLLLTAWNPRAGAGGSAFLYFFVFALFHGGLVIAFALHGQTALLGGGDNSWIDPERLGPAVSLTVIGAAGATAGVALGQIGGSGRGGVRTQRPDAGRLPMLGGGAALVGTAMIAYSLWSNGGLAGVGGYIEFLDVVAGESVFSYGSLFLGLGLCLLAASGGRSRIIAWVSMLVLAALALPLGLRGPVLFPLVTLVMIEAKRRRLRLWVFALVAIAALSAISVIRQTRTQGLAGLLEGGWTRIDPFDGAAEMGYSLFPVVQVEQWMSAGLEPMQGVTFIAPIVRVVERLLGIPSPSGDQDMRLFNVEVFTRIGPIGGSPIAEGYRNFELLGVILVMCILGLVLSRVDRLPGTPMGAALAAVIMLPLVTAVRNSFAPVVPQIAIGLLLVAAAFVGVRARDKGSG